MTVFRENQLEGIVVKLSIFRNEMVKIARVATIYSSVTTWGVTVCWHGAYADMDVLDETLFTHFTVGETEAPEVKIGQ